MTRLAAAALAVELALVLVHAESVAAEPTLSVSGAILEASPARREWRATVEIVIPFDRLFHPGPVAQSAGEQPETPEPAAEDKAEPDASAPRGEAGRREAEKSSVSTPADLERAPAITPRFARATVAAALRAGGFGQSNERLAGLASRARSSALLPELTLRGGRSMDASLRLTPTVTDPYRYTESGGSDLWGEARLSWRLSRLVFAPDELAVERLRGQRAAARLQLVQRVLAALARWQRAAWRSLDPALLPEESLETALEVAMAQALLDTLTAGWFSEHIDRTPSAEPPR